MYRFKRLVRMFFLNKNLPQTLNYIILQSLLKIKCILLINITCSLAPKLKIFSNISNIIFNNGFLFTVFLHTCTFSFKLFSGYTSSAIMTTFYLLSALLGVSLAASGLEMSKKQQFEEMFSGIPPEAIGLICNTLCGK